MKRLFFSMAALMCGMMIWADAIEPAEMGIRYYLPKTDVTISVEFMETHYVPGKYAQWANKFLGVDDAIQEDTTIIEIKDVYLRTNSSPDTSRVYYVYPKAGLQTQWLSMTEEGILYGYNEPYRRKSSNLRRRMKDTTMVRTTIPVSTLEETTKSDSEEKQAYSIAKQIYQLRDNRIYLLSGDAENAPADGVSMKAILKEIDRQEKALVQLFMGQQITSKKCKEFTIDPSFNADSIVMTFGEDTILVHVDPVPVEIKVVKEEDKKAKKQKDAPIPSQIYYNMPGMAHITVTSSMRGELLQETIQVAQLGVSVPLSQDLFSNSAERVKILFDVKTGNILSIRRE